MGKRDEALQLLRQGMSPAAIALHQNVTLATILAYLDQLVGSGRLRRSDILFSVPADIRRPVLQAMADGVDKDYRRIVAIVRKSVATPDLEDIEVVLRYGDARTALGDIYEDVCKIEVGLHHLIRKVLETEFGSGEDGWWRKGIPEPIRKECVRRREEDTEPLDPYCYTDLIDLRTILDKQWNAFKNHLPPAIADNKQAFLGDLLRLNEIRRMVMHPVRGSRPSDKDFEFLLELKKRLGYE